MRLSGIAEVNQILLRRERHSSFSRISITFLLWLASYLRALSSVSRPIFFLVTKKKPISNMR